jgi:hypothetical protein
MLRNLLFIISIFVFTQSFAQNKLNNTSLKSFTSDLVFIENKGQIIDQNGNHRNDIDLKLAGEGLNVFIGKGQLHYQFLKEVKSEKLKPKSSNIGAEIPNSKTEAGNEIETYRMDVALVGANENAELVTEEQQAYYESYYLPQCWNDGKGVVAGSYKKVIYRNIYPNIDWVLYIKDNQLEYDFIVREGGNANDIQIRYNGADKIAALENGGIDAVCAFGKITEQKPTAYELEGSKSIATNFKLQNNLLSFNTARYSGTLVIDPKLVWGTYYGGSGYDQGYSVGCDSANNVYMMGYATSSYNIATTGTYRDTIIGSGYYNTFLVKFNPSGVRQWGTYYGASMQGWYSSLTGSYHSSGNLAIDNVGNIYLQANTTSSNYIATSGAYQIAITFTSGYPNTMGVLAKFNVNGSLKWATYFGGNRGADAIGVGCDKFGHVSIAGITTSDSGIATTGSFLLNKPGGSIKYYDNDGYLATFDSNGNIRWATYYGGYYDDEVDAVVCGKSGNVFIGGKTRSDTGIATSGTFRPVFDTGSYTPGSNGEGFFAKFDSSGARIWGSYFDGQGSAITAMAIDSGDELYIAGGGGNPDMLLTTGTYRSPGGGVLAKFNTSGNRIWGAGVPVNAYSNVTADLFGTVYVVTAACGDSTYTSPGTYQRNCGGGTDGFLIRLTGDGQRLWGTFYGGLLYDYSYGVAADKLGCVFICGSTVSNNGIATSGSHQTSPGTVGAQNGFIAKFNSDTAVALTQPYIDTVLCKGGKFVVGYNTYMPFNSGNVFTVQLSDTNGNFSAPDTIGSITASTSGYDTCTIPSSIHSGKKYRLRIVASDPAFISPDDGYNIHVISNIAGIKAGSNAPICPSDSLKLSATDSTSGILFKWTGPHSFVSNKQNPLINAATAVNSGEYVVTGSATGCADVTDSIKVNVGIPPKPIAGSNSPICYLDTLKLTASDTLSGITYHWLTPDSLTTTKQNPQLVHVSPGYYYVWVSLPHCTSKTDSVNVVLNTPTTPAVTITSVIKSSSPNYTISYTAHATGVYATPLYQWKKNGFNIAGATKDTVTLTGLKSGDVVSVMIQATDHCSIPDTASASIELLDIGNFEAGYGVSVYPNPTTGSMQVTIKSWQLTDNYAYTLTDLAGKVLMTGKINSEKTELNISGFSKGIYLLQVQNAEGEKQLFKIVKE